MKNLIILIMSVLLMSLGYKYYQLSSPNENHKHGKVSLPEVEDINKTFENKKYISLPVNFETKTLEDVKTTAHDSLHEHLEKKNTHHHIPSDIKQALCEEDLVELACVVKKTLDIQKEIVNEFNNAKADEISVVLTSSNFQTVMENLAASKLNEASFELEYKLNDRIDNFLANNQNVSIDRLACGDIVCATSIHYEQQSDWEEFGKAFFKDNSDIGNLFIAHVDSHINQETRILFLPNNTSAVSKRIKK